MGSFSKYLFILFLIHGCGFSSPEIIVIGILDQCIYKTGPKLIKYNCHSSYLHYGGTINPLYLVLANMNAAETNAEFFLLVDTFSNIIV